jgi:ComF family protein
MFQGIVNLFYPRLCVLCNGNLLIAEKHICTACELDLPLTNFHLEKDNSLEKIFWGRTQLNRSFSFVYFKKGGAVQRMLHQLKYKGNTELSEHIGLLYGTQLQETIVIEKIEAVIAIPLHKSKLRKRGYNQSELFANGLAEALQIENLSCCIIRNKATETQTKKTRFDRWQNVESIFSITQPELLKNKHILLLDDVITTGSTIEACANELLQIEGCKVSVASMAAAVR